MKTKDQTKPKRSNLSLILSPSETSQLEIVKKQLGQATSNGTIKQLIAERVQLQITLDQDKEMIERQAVKIAHYEALIIAQDELNTKFNGTAAAIRLSRD